MTQPPDSGARLVALAALVVGSLAAVLAFYFVTHWLAELQASGSREAFGQLLVALGAALAVGVCGAFGIGLFCFRLGRRVCREARFPPANARLITSTIVHTGDNAVRRGQWAQAMGVLFMLFAVVLAVAGIRVIVFFGGPAV